MIYHYRINQANFIQGNIDIAMMTEHREYDSQKIIEFDSIINRPYDNLYTDNVTLDEFGFNFHEQISPTTGTTECGGETLYYYIFQSV